MTKGEVSTRLTPMLDPPLVHYCGRCRVVHTNDMLFRLAAVRAGVELVPGTSPPVMQPGGFRPAATPSPRHDVVRSYLRLLGPATPGHVAAFLDAPVTDVRAHWPDDVVEVTVAGEKRWLLAADRDAVTGPVPDAVRLLGPYDPFVQAQDRPLLVEDPARRKAVWPALGRPGMVLAGGDLAGLWRPRQVGDGLTVRVEWWGKATAAARAAVAREAERLAAFRGIRLARVDHA